MTDLDLTALDDAALATLSGDISREQERRRQLSIIPGQIRALAAAYEQGGGDPADLTLDPAEELIPVEEQQLG